MRRCLYDGDSHVHWHCTFHADLQQPGFGYSDTDFFGKYGDVSGVYPTGVAAREFGGAGDEFGGWVVYVSIDGCWGKST